MKWIFFGYLTAVVLLVAGIAISFTTTPLRDPNTLYAAYGGSVRTLDPAEVGDTVGAALIGPVYECLYNYKYGVKPYETFPEIAADMPVNSADGLTMTIKIRPGIRFYDPEKVVFPDGIGPEITAYDVIYSFKRICDFNLASPNYSGTFEDQIVGLDQWWDYTKHTPPQQIDWERPVEGFQALDAHTVQLKLTNPSPQMIYKLAHEPTGIVCRVAVNKWGKQFRLHPVGSGPYAITENLRDQRIVMTANPIFRGRQDIDGGTPVPEADRLPHIKRVQLDYFEEPLPEWLLFQQGLFDIAGIPKDAFQQAINVDTGNLSPAMAAKGIVLRKSPMAVTEYIGFNMQDPIVGKNKPLRQAMSMAFDRKTYINNFLNGRGIPAIGPIPPGFPTYDEHAVNPNTQFNLSAAREKIREAERINGGPIPPISILMRDADTTSRQMGEFFSAQMRQIGVTLVPEYRDFARWQEMVDNHQTQLFDAGWEADWPDEQNFLQLFYGKFSDPGNLNNTAYVNPEFDALYEKASVMSDTPQRRALYLKMEQIVEEDCPWLIEMYPVAYTLSYDWVGNLQSMDYGYGFRAYVTLNENLRRRRDSVK